MLKVLVAGCNGFIDHLVVLALSRAGHQVYGLTRSNEAAKKLQAEEIIPVIGDAKSPQAWIELVKDVDVVIDTLGGNEVAEICATLFEAMYEIASKVRSEGPPITYIHTSGSWVHGKNDNVVFNDFSPLTAGIPLAAWRVPFERRITSTKTAFIRGIVIRPVNVYGRSGSTLGDMLFKPASEGKLQWYGKPGGRIPTVHQDDLADLFVRVVASAPILGGLAFIAANPESESLDFIISELCKIAGVKEVTYLAAETPLHHALALSHKINPSSARDMLGWTPRKRSLGDGLEEYYIAWKASVGAI